MKDKFSFAFMIIVIICAAALIVWRVSSILSADIPLWLKLSLLK